MIPSIAIDAVPSFPKPWLDVLTTMRVMGFQEALIAGGALRDLMWGLPPKDLDIFIASTADTGRSLTDMDQHPEWHYQSAGSVPAGYTGSMRGEVRSVSGYMVQGVDIPVQVVELSLPRMEFDAEAVVSRMDFYACRIATNGSRIFMAPEAQSDIRARTCTMATPEDTVQAERSLRRADRWLPRFEAAGVKLDLSAYAVPRVAAMSGVDGFAAWVANAGPILAANGALSHG